MEIGIHFNGNEQRIIEGEVFQGGRRFVGLGHDLIPFKAQRFIMAFSDWPQLGQQKTGNIVGEESEVIESWVMKYSPTKCRTNDGLKVAISAALVGSLGLDTVTEPVWEDDLPELSATKKSSIIQLYKMYGAGEDSVWTTVLQSAMLGATCDETARWQAEQFYTDRPAIGRALAERMKRTARQLQIGVHSVHLLNIDLPHRYTEAIMATELARQEVEQAQHEDKTRRIEARTVTLVAEVVSRMLNYTAQKTAEAAFLEQSIAAEAVREKIEERAHALEESKHLLNYTSNKDFLTYVQLSALTDADGSSLTFDSPVPYQLHPSYKPDPGTELYAKASAASDPSS